MLIFIVTREKLICYGYIKRINNKRHTKQIVESYENISEAIEGSMKYIQK